MKLFIFKVLQHYLFNINFKKALLISFSLKQYTFIVEKFKNIEELKRINVHSSLTS